LTCLLQDRGLRSVAKRLRRAVLPALVLRAFAHGEQTVNVLPKACEHLGARSPQHARRHEVRQFVGGNFVGDNPRMSCT
jgi:hypothetical protein